MSLTNRRKINKLIQNWQKGEVYLVKYLNTKGYSSQLINKYKKSKWLQPIGVGAVIRFGDIINYIGALHALQFQEKLAIHPGAKTALLLSGKSHYLEINPQRIHLFLQTGKRAPKWFTEYQWNIQLEQHNTSFLPPNIGLTTIEVDNIKIKISSPARAILECVYLAHEKHDIVECFELMESLNNLRPSVVQELLENCTSIRVKRLFLYLAEKSGHLWFKHLNLSNVDLGAGKREIVKNGIYNKTYKITVPKVLEDNEIPSI